MDYLFDIEWTDEQKEFIDLNKTGKFVVKACPGSGKTTAVTERLYQFIKTWDNKQSGIAVLSFTNVAADEIKEQFNKNKKNLKIEHPHFVGTLDSFINNYVFLPYGNLVMECEGQPMLVGEPFSYWSSDDYLKSQYENVNFTIDGEVNYNREYISNPYSEVKEMKYSFTKKGYATQKDAIYHSMKVLEKFPKIAKAIAIRFPYMIIDEAQDTSNITMRIIELLIENGLKNIILVGDPEQSIYDWNGAKPELLNQKYNKWKKSMEFTSNFRSSQEICDFFAKLSNTNKIISKCKHDYHLKPVLTSYTSNYDEIIKKFLKDCNKHNIELSQKEVCILFRGNEEVYSYKKSFKLKNIYKLFDYNNNIRNQTVNIIRGLYYWNNNEHLKSFEILEKEYLKDKHSTSKITYENIHEEINNIGFHKHRLNVYNFIKSFPPISNTQTIDSWIKLVNNTTSNKLCDVKDKPIKDSPYHAKDITFELIFNEENNKQLNYHVGTVHSVKGCSIDATLLILKNNIYERSYKEITKNNIRDEDELRVIYVALSRAKKLLHLAVPENDYKIWESIFS